MAEQMFGTFRKISKVRAYKQTAEVYKKEGASAAARAFLEKMNVNIRFVRESDPTLATDRQKLNTERGLIISLHPSGVFDPMPALLALNRTDLKIIADNKGGKVADQFSKLFGDGVFIPIDVTQKSTLHEGIKTAQAHVEHGGVVFLFPSSDLDRPGEHHGFRNRIFGDLVRNLNPKDMVYAFKPNEEQSYAVRERYREDYFDKQPMTIDVDECYTSSAGWKEVIDAAGKNKPAVEDGLRAHYDSLFKK